MIFSELGDRVQILICFAVTASKAFKVFAKPLKNTKHSKFSPNREKTRNKIPRKKNFTVIFSDIRIGYIRKSRTCPAFVSPQTTLRIPEVPCHKLERAFINQTTQTNLQNTNEYLHMGTIPIMIPPRDGFIFQLFFTIRIFTVPTKEEQSEFDTRR